MADFLSFLGKRTKSLLAIKDIVSSKKKKTKPKKISVKVRAPKKKVKKKIKSIKKKSVKND